MYFIVVERRNRYLFQSLVGLRVSTDNRLQFIRLNACDLPHHFHFDVLGVIFWDRQVAWGVVLLIGHNYVRNERRFRWQKRDSKLYRFTVPVLAIFTQVAYAFDYFVLLVQKSKFRAKTKVAYTKETYFFKDVLSGQLNYKSI